MIDLSLVVQGKIFDNSPTSGHLDYYNSSSVLTSTRNITNVSDNQKNTYTFTLNDPVFVNQLSTVDFRLVNVGPEDITVRWVRIIR